MLVFWLNLDATWPQFSAEGIELTIPESSTQWAFDRRKTQFVAPPSRPDFTVPEE